MSKSLMNETNRDCTTTSNGTKQTGKHLSPVCVHRATSTACTSYSFVRSTFKSLLDTNKIVSNKLQILEGKLTRTSQTGRPTCF